jgi:hypothetical protein
MVKSGQLAMTCGSIKYGKIHRAATQHIILQHNQCLHKQTIIYLTYAMVQARWWWVSSSYINMAASPSSTIAHVQTKFKNVLIESSTCQFAWYLHLTAMILAQIVIAWFMQWNGNAGITRQ